MRVGLENSSLMPLLRLGIGGDGYEDGAKENNYDADTCEARSTRSYMLLTPAGSNTSDGSKADAISEIMHAIRIPANDMIVSCWR